MGRKKHRSQLDAIDEINMTPLIDLTFLLLIIFMITAPLLEFGLDVSPPEMNAAPIDSPDSRVVNIDRQGRIVFNDQVLSNEQLFERLRAIRGANPKTAIFVRADGDRAYREVIRLMDTVKKAGFDNISLVTRAADD